MEPCLELRPYQQKLVESVRASYRAGRRAPLCVAPTGAGKTVCFSFFTKAAVAKGNRVFILVHRDELIDQVSETLSRFSVDHSFIAAGRKYSPESMVQIASVFSLVRRLESVARPNLIICDECHHATSNSTWGKIFNHFQNAFRLGVTASPCRLSGEPLGDIFDDIIIGPPVSELIKSGALSNYKIFVPPYGIDTSKVKTQMGDFSKKELEIVANKSIITGHAIAEYKKHAHGKRAVVFCVSIKHAEEVALEFREAGYRALSLDGTMDREIRRSIVDGYKKGKIDILTVVGLLTEGFDLSAIEVAIMLRPTKSLGLWIQMVGRALRPFPGKDYAIILDHAGNTLLHGLPDEDREWSLSGRVKRKKGDAPVKICPQCFAAVFSAVFICTECGHEFEKQTRGEPAKVDGELVEADKEALKRRRFSEQSNAKSLEDLIQLGRSRNYKSPVRWAEHIISARAARKR